MFIRFARQLTAQSGNGVILIVKLRPQQQEPPFLRTKKENEPHHDGKSGFVEFRRSYIAQEFPVAVLIRFIQTLNQNFHGCAHLIAKCVGNFFQTIKRFIHKRRKSFVFRTEETTNPQKRRKRLQGPRFLEP